MTSYLLCAGVPSAAAIVLLVLLLIEKRGRADERAKNATLTAETTLAKQAAETAKAAETKAKQDLADVAEDARLAAERAKKTIDDLKDELRTAREAGVANAKPGGVANMLNDLAGAVPAEERNT